LSGSFKTPVTISYDEYNGVTLDNDTGNRFIIVNQVTPWPNEGFLSPITTEKAGNNVILQLNLSAPAPANTQMDTFVMFIKCIEFGSGILRLY